MSDYEEKANEFAKKFGVKLTVIGQPSYKKHFSDDKVSRWVFKMKLTRNNKSYTFDFGQSINAGHKVPNMYDVLATIEKSDVGSFEDFCDEFGYEEYIENDYGRQIKNKQVLKIYHAVIKEYEAVERLFGDIIEELYEIQ